MLKVLKGLETVACFHYLTSFKDLEGFTGVNRQMKYSADMTFL